MLQSIRHIHKQMNLLAILGLIFVAVGSWLIYVAKERLVAVLGFIIVGIGSGMLYIASRRDSKKDSARAEKLLEQADEKIDAVRSELSALASQPASPEKEAALDSIDAEFGAWADDFVRNQERTRIEIEQMDAEKVKKQLDDATAASHRAADERKAVNDRFHSLFSFAVGAIGKAINAYNAKSGAHFVVDLPAVPYDLCSKSSESYRGSVNFDGKATWFLSIRVPDSMWTPFGDPDFPSMTLSIEHERDQIGSVRIGAPHNAPDIAVTLQSQVLPHLSEIAFRAPFDDYESKLVRSMQRLVEAQVYLFK